MKIMSQQKCIFFFGITRFDAPVESTSYTLAKKLAENNQVYYIEYPFTFFDKLKYSQSAAFKLRIKSLSNNKGIISSGIPNLYIVALPTVLSIHFLPEGQLYRRLLNYNESIIAKHLKKIVANNSLQDIVYINSWVFHYPNIARYLKPKLSIYHCVDPVFTPYDAKHGLVSENILINQSSLIICTSQQLYREKIRINANTHFIPNAADIVHCVQATNPELPIHPSLNNIPKPIIGYFGNIERRMDYELIREVALKNRNMSFVFAGPIEKHLVPDYLFDITNVYFTGRVPYNEMPNMVKGFDAAIIPFKRTMESSTVFPLKLFEYLGAGKPVIATNFNMDLKTFTDDLVVYCDSAEQFSCAINDALVVDSVQLQNKRIELARQHTWERRAFDFEFLIDKQLAIESKLLDVKEINQ